MMNDNIFNIPSMSLFNNDWGLLLKFMENEGNPPFHFDGNLNLSFREDIESLGNLVSVGGNLDLRGTNFGSLQRIKRIEGGFSCFHSSIINLGDLEYVGGMAVLSDLEIKSLGKLEYVGRKLDISNTLIDSLGNLKFVGSHLDVTNTKNLNMGEKEIREKVLINGVIYGR